MLFLNTILLLGALGISIPIIIHLLNRRSSRVVDWGAMNFLLESLAIRNRRIQLEEALLMAARCLLVGLLALALARPFIPPGSTIPWLLVLPLLLLAVVGLGVAVVLHDERVWRRRIAIASTLILLLCVALIFFEKHLNLSRFQPGARQDIALILDASTSMGIAVGADNRAALSGADVVVLAVKPQVLGAVVKALPLHTGQLVVSIAAGVPIASLEQWTRPDQPIVRCMPNTPALVGAGITGLYANTAVSAAGRARASTILGAVGATIWVDEEQLLDAVTAVSGSGPAYYFYLMEAMIEAGEALGLPRATAMALTLETAYGAALMARQPGADPAILRANVTSPGGTTERALDILGAADLRGIVQHAINGAALRAGELATEFGQS